MIIICFETEVQKLITAQKMKFPIKDFFSKYDQIRSFLRIWSHLLKISLMENFTFYAVYNLEISSREAYLLSKYVHQCRHPSTHLLISGVFN